VPSEFLVGPERAGVRDERGHRYYAALLQATRRNNINLAAKLKDCLCTDSQICNH
jgi:hypothetical protein